MSPGAVRSGGAGGETRNLGPNTADQSKGEPTTQDGPKLGKSDGGCPPGLIAFI